MADTPSQPPGWPYNQDPDAAPAPPEIPSYEPPPSNQPPPGAPQFQPPQPAAPGQPPSPYPSPGQPPAPYTPPAPAASPYEPPVPGAPPAAPYAPPAAAPYPPQPQPAAPQYGGPGQPPPPPGWGPQVAPAKKSRRGLWITLAVIFGVLVLAIGSCSFWFYNTVTAPVDKSNEFLAAIDRADYAEAIALSDPLCSQGMSEADLAAVFGGADIDYNLNNSSIVNSNATVSGSFSVAGESVSRIEVFLRNNDGWAVCGFDAE